MSGLYLVPILAFIYICMNSGIQTKMPLEKMDSGDTNKYTFYSKFIGCVIEQTANFSKYNYFCTCTCCGAILSLVQFFFLCLKLIIIHYHTFPYSQNKEK